ncbi:OmpA family protein [Spirosoma sp.]|uniref:OmpA family protein n=1 Tax=Spirosoma sp. TaxID=1899569 RepID=UPI003B3B3984
MSQLLLVLTKGVTNQLIRLLIVTAVHCLFNSYQTHAQSTQSLRVPPLIVSLRFVDTEADTTVANAKLSATDEKTGQVVPVLPDSAGFKLSAQSGSTIIIQASAPDYLPATSRIPKLSMSQRVIIKLLHKKPSVLTIKAFDVDISQPLPSAVAIITSQTTGKTERFSIKNGRLQRAFTKPDKIDVQVTAPGYTTARRQLSITVPDLGNRYEFDAELDKITYSLTVRAIDSRTGEPILGGQFAVTNPVGVATIALSPTPRIGFSRAKLPGLGTYQLTGNANGYENVTQSLIIDQEKNEVIVRLTAKNEEVALQNAKNTVQVRPTTLSTNVASVSAVSTKTFGVIERGKSIRLNKIYFDQSSPVLRPESYAELDQLYAVLMQYPSLRIEIRGYTDNQGDFDLNTQLARDRCRAVVDYLSKKGIRRNRLNAVGRGPLDPVAPNNNEENRKKNRRVEFVLL